MIGQSLLVGSIINCVHYGTMYVPQETADYYDTTGLGSRLELSFSNKLG